MSFKNGDQMGLNFINNAIDHRRIKWNCDLF